MMNHSTDTIPEWDYSGLLPPIQQDDPASDFRSPYVVPLTNLVTRFGNTEDRRRLLDGLLKFRAMLHDAKLIRGFQWINGSFAENVEHMEKRSPDDIDLVTFFYIPDGYTEETLVRDFGYLFDNCRVRSDHHIDAYFVPLGHSGMKRIISRSIYWYSLWSHTRDGLWKGYLQVDLANEEDQAARVDLDRMNSEGGRP